MTPTLSFRYTTVSPLADSTFPFLLASRLDCWPALCLSALLTMLLLRLQCSPSEPPLSLLFSFQLMTIITLYLSLFKATHFTKKKKKKVMLKMVKKVNGCVSYSNFPLASNSNLYSISEDGCFFLLNSCTAANTSFTCLPCFQTLVTIGNKIRFAALQLGIERE